MTLQEALNTTLSPDKVKDMETSELVKYLVDNQVFDSEADLRMFLIEGIQRAVRLDHEFPIKIYTSKDEEVPEDHKYVDVGPQLTDEYIENNMQE
jgi:hypothetical protein